MRARKRTGAPAAGEDLTVEGGIVVSRRGREGPNPFRRQHGAPRAIDRYRERGSITERQYQAADTLWCDLMRAGLAPKVTANLLGAGGGGEAACGMAITAGQVDARARIRVVADRLGRRLWGVLQAVIWNEMAASAWAGGYGVTEASKARAAGIMALRLALDTLADHYRLPNGD